MSSKPTPSFDDALDARTKKPGNRCGVALAYAAMPAAQREKVEAAMSNPRRSGAAISGAMGDIGYPTTRHSVERHRRGDCQCG
jgi:hypothetical protein